MYVWPHDSESDKVFQVIQPISKIYQEENDKTFMGQNLEVGYKIEILKRFLPAQMPMKLLNYWLESWAGLDEIAPIKTVQTRTNYAPWLEKDKKKLQQLRNDAQSQAAQSKDPEDWRLYTNLRNQSTAKGRADKKAWEEKKLDHNKNSTTDMWTTVKGWLGWGATGPPTQLFSEGRWITSPAGIATAMNKFFMDKIKKLRDKVPLANSDPLGKIKEAMSRKKCSFKIKQVSTTDVLKIIKDLKNSSASGVDYIDTKTVKLVADVIAPALKHIINRKTGDSTKI